MNNELGHADPYQIDDNSPTLTFVAGDQTLALPYHLVRAMHLGGDGRKIAIDFDEREVTVRGSSLDRLWKELRAFRVREVSINAGEAGKAIGGKAERALVEMIEIAEKADGSDAD